MNQRLKLQNGYQNNENQAVFQGINTNSNYWTYGKLKPLQPEIRNIQVQNEILKSLPPNILQELLPQMEAIYVKSGEYLYQPDDIINNLYFPETAIISDFQILQDGKTMEVAMTGREGMVGIGSIFNPQSSPHWIQVSIPGKVWRLDSKTFRQKFNTCESLQGLIFEHVNQYIAQISQKVICNSHHSVEERLCCWLLMISDRCGSNNLPLTQEQIAGFLGVHRPSVTLITQALRDNGAINYLRGKISIVDKMKLEFASCDCYSSIKGNLNCRVVN